MFKSIANVGANPQCWRAIDEGVYVLSRTIVSAVLRNPIFKMKTDFKERKEFKFHVATVLCANAISKVWKFPELVHHSRYLILHL